MAGLAPLGLPRPREGDVGADGSANSLLAMSPNLLESYFSLPAVFSKQEAKEQLMKVLSKLTKRHVFKKVDNVCVLVVCKNQRCTFKIKYGIRTHIGSEEVSNYQLVRKSLCLRHVDGCPWYVPLDVQDILSGCTFNNLSSNSALVPMRTSGPGFGVPINPPASQAPSSSRARKRAPSRRPSASSLDSTSLVNHSSMSSELQGMESSSASAQSTNGLYDFWMRCQSQSKSVSSLGEIEGTRGTLSSNLISLQLPHESFTSNNQESGSTVMQSTGLDGLSVGGITDEAIPGTRSLILETTTSAISGGASPLEPTLDRVGFIEPPPLPMKQSPWTDHSNGTTEGSGPMPSTVNKTGCSRAPEAAAYASGLQLGLQNQVSIRQDLYSDLELPEATWGVQNGKLSGENKIDGTTRYPSGSRDEYGTRRMSFVNADTFFDNGEAKVNKQRIGASATDAAAKIKNETIVPGFPYVDNQGNSTNAIALPQGRESSRARANKLSLARQDFYDDSTKIASDGWYDERIHKPVSLLIGMNEHGWNVTSELSDQVQNTVISYLLIPPYLGFTKQELDREFAVNYVSKRSSSWTLLIAHSEIEGAEPTPLMIAFTLDESDPEMVGKALLSAVNTSISKYIHSSFKVGTMERSNEDPINSLYKERFISLNRVLEKETEKFKYFAHRKYYNINLKSLTRPFNTMSIILEILATTKRQSGSANNARENTASRITFYDENVEPFCKSYNHWR